MRFIYAPEGVDPKTWDFAPGKMISPEAEVIERKTGMRFSEWEFAVQNGSMLALHGLLFVLLKREQPSLQWDQIMFSFGECTWELDDDEVATALARLDVLAKEGRLTEREAEFYEVLKAQAPPEDDEPEADEPDPTEPAEPEAEVRALPTRTTA